VRGGFFGLAILPTFPLVILAQGVPGTNIKMDVVVTGVSIRGDTADVTYLLRNRPGSAEQLFQFAVEAPSPVLRISIPQPERDWLAHVSYRSRSIAHWGVLGEEVQPGEQSPPLGFSAIGLPAIVPYWVRGWAEPPVLTEADTLPFELIPPSDPLVDNSVKGSTVGIAPFPGDRGPGSLLLRLALLTDQTCGGLAWIASASVCSNLTAKLQHARAAVTRGDNNAARARLGDFLAELATQHDATTTPAVNDAAFWLLKTNAEFVLRPVPAASR
jgi:hypothetical protein